MRTLFFALLLLPFTGTSEAAESVELYEGPYQALVAVGDSFKQFERCNYKLKIYRDLKGKVDDVSIENYDRRHTCRSNSPTLLLNLCENFNGYLSCTTKGNPNPLYFVEIRSNNNPATIYIRTGKTDGDFVALVPMGHSGFKSDYYRNYGDQDIGVGSANSDDPAIAINEFLEMNQDKR